MSTSLDRVWRTIDRLMGYDVSEPVCPKPQHYRVVNPYHAVSVVPGESACGVARALQDTRFLSAEAPRIPLAGCTHARCRCAYRHFEDRRADHGESREDRRRTARFVADERRQSRGRRVSDPR